MTKEMFELNLICVLLYLIVFFCVVALKKTKQLKWYDFPLLKLKKDGIEFITTLTHRIKIADAKMTQLCDKLYLNLNGKLIIISNVKDVKIFDEYLYFTGLGKVEIITDLKEIYKYFSITIKSEQFFIDEIKQSAIIDLINNNFEINFCKNLKRYIKIIENVLNIHIYQEKIIVKSNKYNLSFELIYKLNNKIKRVIID